MKLYKSTLSREECLKNYGGYTELNGKRMVLRELPDTSSPAIRGNAIVFGYEYDSNGAETGLNQQMVEHILQQLTTPIFQHPTYGGYVDQQGTQIEEHGMLLTFAPKVSPVELGATAHKIAETFRQASVLVIYKEEAQFIYA